MRKIFGFLAVLLLATILTPNVWGALQFGTVFFDETTPDGGTLKGQIDFGVFDFESISDYADFTFNLNVEAPFLTIGEDEYVYAYLITNDDPLSDTAISSFSIFAKETAEVIDGSAQRGSFSDSRDEISNEGIEPSSSYYDDGSESIVWNFGESGEAYIEISEHSWWLMLKSTSAPIIGDYDIKSPAEESDPLQIPGESNLTTNPEPATIALFGLGSLILFRKKNPKQHKTYLKK